MSRKCKDPGSLNSDAALPPSKTSKTRSVLDQTLSKLSQQLIHHKLAEHRQELVRDIDSGGGEDEENQRNASPSPTHGFVATPTSKVIKESQNLIVV